MALANFFGKNALAAAQILGGMTPETLSTLLGDHVVGIAFDESAASSPEGCTTLELATNLAARLYPAMAVIPLDLAGEASRRLTVHLKELARAINPEVELLESTDRVTVAIVAGDTTYPAGAEPSLSVIYAGSSGWHACISTAHPVGSADTSNPVGAAAAACFALANVFRAVFESHLPAPERDNGFALSLFDYTIRPAPHGSGDVLPAGGPDLAHFPLDLSETILGGVGAIGNAAVWTLARVKGLSGTLVLVDGETISLTNLQRYVLAMQEHVTSLTPKAELAETVLRSAATAHGGTRLRVVPHQLTWGEFLRQRGDYRIERVATAFDTVDARLAVQASLPRRIVNAWTQRSDLGVSRHFAFGTTPCVSCAYPQRPGGRSDAELVAEAMVIPEPAFEIRDLLHSGAPITDDFIRGVAVRRQIISTDRIERLLQYAGLPLRHFYQEVFCGGLVLEFGGAVDGSSIRVEAPIAFQSALAGVMLAAEIVIDAGRLRGEDRDKPPTRTVIDLLRPLWVYVPTFSRRSDGHCLCEDADYLGAYEDKYRLTLANGVESP